ncbi:diguanylate cyclase (GGDEF) domain-containing protein [Hoeflea sp. IMCC20628]|uniref:GGDEF domain-containing response regulator n=1 Tax=Hoeflea sp. IMCC20628 TaxID=1620421 RepID=UPI00063BDDB1|nr:diguanylate cyclase [Hoeflea sp. IMCC20628]AKI02018.1 diguanylate cyclase (GGDEF) domain-containing protein [Hoeflea sp. IMCC20628]
MTMLNAISLDTGIESDMSEPVETVFSNASQPSVHVIGGRQFLHSIALILAPMSYTSTPVNGRPHLAVVDEPSAGTIVVIDGSLPDALEICSDLGETAPKILVSPETSFSFRAKCAQAHVSTVMSAPIDQAEFINWLEYLGGQMTSQPASILLVDDDPLASAVYAEMLRANGMTVAVLNDPLKIIMTIERSYFDLIIMDLQMPGTDGIEIAKIIRQHQNHLSIPIVFLSSEEDKQVQMKARQFGGDDFISKRADLDALVSLIHLRVQRARVLRNLIERDGLTGLLNHRRFKERVGQEMSRTKRTNLQFCIAMIDVDHFKKVNDTWGHPVGDKVLSILARALVGWVRKTDVVGRYGGEEFAVLLLDTSPDTIFEVMENFRKHFAKMVFDGQDGKFSLTVSIGVAGSDANGDSAALFAQADKAMYLAKSNGRDQVVIAGTDELPSSPDHDALAGKS